MFGNARFRFKYTFKKAFFFFCSHRRWRHRRRNEPQGNLDRRRRGAHSSQDVGMDRVQIFQKNLPPPPVAVRWMSGWLKEGEFLHLLKKKETHLAGNLSIPENTYSYGVQTKA